VAVLSIETSSVVVVSPLEFRISSAGTLAEGVAGTEVKREGRSDAAVEAEAFAGILSIKNKKKI
jgi:hypothetical protein